MTMNLKKEMTKALRNGGVFMSDARRAKVFEGVSPRRASLILRACASPDMVAAIRCGTVGDVAVTPVLLNQGEVVAKTVLQLEMKLGRKLSLARATALMSHYKAVVSAQQKPSAQIIPMWLAKPAAPRTLDRDLDQQMALAA